jgi:hypothetical protein
MNVTQFKQHLSELDSVEFTDTDYQMIPAHFHITEVGVVTKDFIDCGGTIRQEKTATFQLWVADDTDHRLKPQKLLDIIDIAEKSFDIGDLEIEIEYQGITVGKYALEFDEEGFFRLVNKKTDCLAKDKCGIPIVENDCCGGSSCC